MPPRNVGTGPVPPTIGLRRTACACYNTATPPAQEKPIPRNPIPPKALAVTVASLKLLIRAGNPLIFTEPIVVAMQTPQPLSVVMREHVERLRAWAKDRCVMAD